MFDEEIANILANIPIFYVEISIFDQNFDFWTKFRLPTKISIVDNHFDFRPKFSFLRKNSSLVVDLVDNFRKFPKQSQNVTIYPYRL